MSAVSATDIESELSYALLHAIASKAGASCVSAARLSDNRGIDAHLTYWSNNPSALRKEVDLKVQLKATTKVPVDNGTHYSYSLDNDHYNDLRAQAYATPRILIVFYLPKLSDDWLKTTESELTMKRAAYWVSLRGAKDPVTKGHTTVYLPKSQMLSEASLKKIFDDLTLGQFHLYGS